MSQQPYSEPEMLVSNRHMAISSWLTRQRESLEPGSIQPTIGGNMAVSMVDTYFSPHLAPQAEVINPRLAALLVKIIDTEFDDEPITIDFQNVKVLTNLAARILCKAFYNRDDLSIENSNPAVQSSLEWAADYLYQKGELDGFPEQVRSFSL